MPLHYTYTIHDERALWPEHKPLAEVLELQAITPAKVFSATWQGSPTPEGGLVFQRSWWDAPEMRYAIEQPSTPEVIGRWITIDTALKDKADSDYTVMLVFELLADYRGRVRDILREKITFPTLPGRIREFVQTWAKDDLLRGVLIEDKGSGTSAIQTLQQVEDAWLRHLIIPFMPTTPKEIRAEQAAVWCANGCVLLPKPHKLAPFLLDLQAELFQFPGAEHDDIVDTFAMAVIYTEHFLSDGHRARNGWL
jgi:predicted phage terminase large subunit-like protein